jgi:hypothetical protein
LQNQQNHFIITTNYLGTVQMAKYYGGSASGTDISSDLSISKNTITLSGKSTSTLYPVTPGAYQTIHKGNEDGVLTKIAYTNTLSSVGKSETSAIEPFSVFPNPTNSFIIVKASASIIENLIFDCHGLLLLKTKENTINLTEYTPGIYFIKNNLGCKKIIKN